MADDGLSGELRLLIDAPVIVRPILSSSLADCMALQHYAYQGSRDQVPVGHRDDPESHPALLARAQSSQEIGARNVRTGDERPLTLGQDEGPPPSR